MGWLKNVAGPGACGSSSQFSKFRRCRLGDFSSGARGRWGRRRWLESDGVGGIAVFLGLVVAWSCSSRLWDHSEDVDALVVACGGFTLEMDGSLP